MKVKATDYEAPDLIDAMIRGATSLAEPGWTPLALFIGSKGVITTFACPSHTPNEVRRMAEEECLDPRSGPWT